MVTDDDDESWNYYTWLQSYVGADYDIEDD